MKRFLGTKLAVIIITVLTCLVVFGTFSFAAGVFNKDVPASGRVTAVNPNIELYSDAACTIPLAVVVFPEINRGDSYTTPLFYVKNTGNKQFNGFTVSSDLDPAIGTISGSGSFLGTVLPDGVFAAQFTLIAAEGTTTDDFSCAISVDGNY